MMSSETPVTPRPGLGAMLIGILVRPRRTLQAVAEHNGRGWWLPALLMVVLTVTTVVVTGPITARMMREQLAQMPGAPGASGGTSPEQLQQTLDFATSPVFTTVLPAASSAVGLLIGWVVQAGLFYLAVTVLGGHTRFGALWGIVLWATPPLAVRALIQTVYIAASNQTIANPGLSGLIEMPANDPLALLKIPAGQRALAAALGQVDLFVVWNLVLLVIGLAAAARFSHRKAALIVLVFWALSVGLNVLITIAGASLAGGAL